MIKQYSWKHVALAIGLTIALCAGIFLYNQWDLSRFKKSLGDDTTQTLPEEQSDKTTPNETSQPISTQPESDEGKEESNVEHEEKEVADSEEKDEEDASFYDFLNFLDELSAEEFANLLESLDLEDDEKEAIAELVDQESEIAEDVHPSSMIIDFMESGVASLAALIELMEETTTLMPEGVQERYASTLSTLHTMQVNGGGLIFHRPPENPDRWMLFWINPSPSQAEQRNRGPSYRMENMIHEIPSVGPNNESLFLHKGNSIIID